MVTAPACFSIINEPVTTVIAHRLGMNIEETFWPMILVVARGFEVVATNDGTHLERGIRSA